MSASATVIEPGARHAAAARHAAKRRRRAILRALEVTALIVVALFVLFPIVWMVLTAFKSPIYVYSYTIWFPPTLENFREVFGSRWNIGEKIINSTVIAVSTVTIATPIAVCAAYAFSRLQFAFKRTMFQWILLTQFIPAVTIILPARRHNELVDRVALGCRH